ncbi:Gfo/Idh/MocA family protein [Aurantimonas sp. VKM B-3413]|uniref:Gfo/Idh/MocA family protein n=1 Tax=Aurantimonas sp. VKM B-3413 TaxID=2779401 RepID=UPI001E65A437|nr:Gfo/Idh/MocA family oxidoreductase [Aurantimonas sp. VKM B-3413]MCB8839323.1 Gfo/Idh/MocA family oxidoreductase [Aurantimonas sp. VKM B-3413]
MTKRRVAIVGLGMVADVHARSLIDLSDRVEVAYAFSPTPARRESFAGRYPFPTAGSIDAILGDPSVDALIVLTPPNTHGDIVGKAAAAGKHVLLEKPLEITTERAEAMVAACEAAGATLGIVLQHRFRPAAERLAEILGRGDLGAVAGCSTTIRLWRPQGYYDEPGRGTLARDGGGVLLTQGIHTLDLMLSLAGPVVEVRGFAGTSPLHRMETEDMVAAGVRFANGALGTIDATTAAYPGFPERIELICAHGTAVLAGTGLDIAFRDGRRERFEPVASEGGTGADPMAFPHDWHRSAIADFLDTLDERRAPRVTGREALKAHRLIDALIEAGRTGASVTVAGS